MVYVQDDGDGIAAEDKPKLFKLFGKLKQKKGVNSRGIGLGLNICKQICELFEGSIDCDSEKGFGSKFFFKFKVTELVQSKETLGTHNSVGEIDVSLNTSGIFSHRDEQIVRGTLC